MEPFGILLKKFIEKLFIDFQKKIFLASLEQSSNKEIMKSVVKRLCMNIGAEIISKAHSKAFSYADDLIEEVKGNTFTTNDHYLNDSIESYQNKFCDKCELASDPIATSMKSHFVTVCQILGFLKTCKKLLPDQIQMHFTWVLETVKDETKKGIRDFMMSKETLQSIKESKSIMRTRANCIEREGKIEAVLNEISFL